MKQPPRGSLGFRSKSSASLKTSHGVKAREHPDVTVIFTDIVGFTEMCKEVKPFQVLKFLEQYFNLVDEIAEEHGVTKIRTVGDGYLAATGIMADMGVKEDAKQHVYRSLVFGAGVMSRIRDEGLRMPNDKELVCRVGLAHGHVLSGVVGRWSMQYDIFGDIANLAARMEQTAHPNSVHMPKSSFDKMMDELTESQRDVFADIKFTTREKVAIKNMGEIDTVSLQMTGNENQVDALLIGCMSDDTQRAVAMHIGVLTQSFRLRSWNGPKTRRSETEAKKVPKEGSSSPGAHPW